MKKAVRWIGAAVIFVIIGLILFVHISEVLRRKGGGAADMVHSFYEIEENTLDVLCMGSSHGYSAFQPNTLWNEFGLTSYVLCSQRQTVATTYYLLQEALKYQKPKVLFLETYYFFSSEKYTDEAALRLAFDGIRPGEVKCRMVEDLLQDLSVKDKLSYYIPFLKYHGRWNDLSDTDFHSKSYLKGSIFDFTSYPMEEPELPTEGRELPEVVTEYFTKIVELCEENDIQLVLFTAPYGYIDNFEGYLNRQKISVTLETYLADLDIPYLYFQKTNEAGIDYASDFRDYAHLNTYGAMKITRSLGNYLAANFDMPDHRQDEAYASWQEDFEEFQRDMNAETGAPADTAHLNSVGGI